MVKTEIIKKDGNGAIKVNIDSTGAELIDEWAAINKACIYAILKDMSVKDTLELCKIVLEDVVEEAFGEYVANDTEQSNLS